MAYAFAEHLARFGPDAAPRPITLSAARRYCADLTRSHYENFSVASLFLPRRLRPHFHPVYAWCRWADDLGDETGADAPRLLAWWREQLLTMYEGKATHPVLIALRPTVQRFRIPPTPFLDLISAFEQDQHVKEYRTYDELLGYCKRSANPVGRIVLHLAESFDEERARLSDEICTGLQLANFWQDVRRDWTDLGRIYLPEEDRRRFGVNDDDLKAGKFTPEFRELMRFEVERTRGHFERGAPLIGMIRRDIRKQIALFRAGGCAILQRIEEVRYDVLSERPRLSKWAKLKLMLATPQGVACGVAIETSYTWCRKLARSTAKNFYFAFLVLPRAQRRAMDALYAFMRVTDDLADDEGDTDKRQSLNQWKQQLDDCLHGIDTHPLHPALRDIVKRYRIDPVHLHEVIDGMMLDLEPVRIESFTELRNYCYLVASAVGLCCIPIWGCHDKRAREPAEAAGLALQLTNILRDLGEDRDRGRVYLPRDELARFGSPPEQWGKGESFKEMMRFQVARARGYYREAEKLNAFLNPGGRAVFRVMMNIYEELLDQIEDRDYDVFTRRISVSKPRKLRHLLGAFPIRWGWR